jgi:hypothetical protein
VGEHTWKPIASAPKDGTPVILSDGMEMACGQWEVCTSWQGWAPHGVETYVTEDCWIDFTPLYWMPCPPLPEDV